MGEVPKLAGVSGDGEGRREGRKKPRTQSEEAPGIRPLVKCEAQARQTTSFLSSRSPTGRAKDSPHTIGWWRDLNSRSSLPLNGEGQGRGITWSSSAASRPRPGLTEPTSHADSSQGEREVSDDLAQRRDVSPTQ